MERERTPPITNTKRCLFPEDDLDTSQSSSVFFQIGAVESPLAKGIRSQDDSPTGVQAYPMQAAEKKSSIRSRIAMGDSGAEVLVDMSLLSIHTPEKEEAFRRTNSLLDTRSSPALSRDESFVFHVVEDSPFGKCYHNAGSSPFGLQTSIALCLGDAEEDFQVAAAGCHSWQPWSYFSSNEEQYHSPGATSAKNRLTNRAINQEARKIRIQHIRRELNPFNKSPDTQKHFAKSRSFSIASHTNAETKETRSYSKFSTRSEATSTQGFSDVIQRCTMPESSATSTPMIIRNNHYFDSEEKEVDVFYDSDPEDFTRTCARTPRKRNEKKGLYQRGVAGTPPGNFGDIYSDEAFSTVAQEFVNSTATLIYHPTNTGSTASQVVVNAWVERGQDFGDALIQPKWMWKPISGDSNSRQSMHMVNGIDLLCITRILKVHQIDRCRHPFAKPSSCFVVRTVDGDDFFFEAESEAERDYMVYAMKMVIARFGAMVLNQDDLIHEEFFATSDPVPGSIPAVLTRVSV